MKSLNSAMTRLEEYQPPEYRIHSVELIIRIFDAFTQVATRMKIERNGDAQTLPPLVLNGVDQEIKGIFLDKDPVSDYSYQQNLLTLQPTQPAFTFSAVTHIYPNDNTSLEGLYRSGSMYCTQCEAQGFRKITFYLDRPDVMATFTTRIEADRAQYPILLANGNLIDEGELDDNRHYVVWHDPFVKPCYLFATVMGDLHCNEDRFVTQSGRSVTLKIYVEPKNKHKTDFAMASLKRAMAWDEQTYGREYDLDIFMVVASDYFNMGAMENKGLNIFNSAAVLATPETATDERFERIEAIVAHEYFHNWSGNRVTCRDWFQLSLKEGFTVFRDGQFTSDMHDATLKRIQDVTFLMNYQFPEDSGPNAHPVKPQEYLEINNFYTVTIYEKGAEVVGMIRTIVGADVFRQGSDLYFDRFDGQAVTTEDFVACMEEVSGFDFTQFKRWYNQAGTPEVTIQEHYDSEQHRYRLQFSQTCPATPGQTKKEPFVIPIKLALLDAKGNELPLASQGHYNSDTQVFLFSETVQSIEFDGIKEQPIASLFRDFSAPVRVKRSISQKELLILAQYDSNVFNRFDAIQSIYMQALLKSVTENKLSSWRTIEILISNLLQDHSVSFSVKAAMLTLPSYQMLVDNLEQVDPQRLAQAKQQLQKNIAVSFASEWLRLSHELTHAEPYQFNADEVGRRALQAVSLNYWVISNQGQDALHFAEALYRAANNQTDRLNGLKAILKSDQPALKKSLLDHFYHQWHSDTQMLETWLSLQSSSEDVSIAEIDQLLDHPEFDITNPNKVRAVLGGFVSNFKHFHDAQGLGYQLLATQIIKLDGINPMVAARLVRVFENWRRYADPYASYMKASLEQILASPDLSSDVLELVQKALD